MRAPGPLFLSIAAHNIHHPVEPITLFDERKNPTSKVMRKHIKLRFSLAGVLLAVTAASAAEIMIHPSVEVRIPTSPGSSYQLQASADLSEWIDVGFPFVGDGETIAEHFSTIGTSSKFYRVEETTPASAVEIDLMSYLNPFGRRVYDNIEDGVEPAIDWTTRWLGTTVKNGDPVMLMQEYDESGFTNDQDFLSTEFSDYLAQTGGHDSGGSDFFSNKPVPILLRRFVPGEAYGFTGFHRDDLGDVNLTLVMTFEPVTVPLETYNSLKVVSTSEVLPPSPAAGTYVFTHWYVANVGLVKRIQEDGTIWNLKQFSVFTP